MRLSILLFTAVALLAPAAVSTASDDLWPARAQIEHFLKKAKVTQRVDIGTGVTKPQRVTLELDGVVRQACFKKIEVKQQDNWRSEIAAYELDKLLGLGMVPPTVPRSIGGRQGGLQLWVTGTSMETYDEGFPDIESWRDQVSVMWLFDDLIGNCDRHLNNAIVSPDHRLILIDNSKTFRYEETLRNDLNARGTGTHCRFWGVEFDADRQRYPTRYPRALVERLRTLTDKEIKNAIKKYVWGSTQRLVLKRRELILERLDAMGPQALRPPTLLSATTQP